MMTRNVGGNSNTVICLGSSSRSTERLQMTDPPPRRPLDDFMSDLLRKTSPALPPTVTNPSTSTSASPWTVQTGALRSAVSWELIHDSAKLPHRDLQRRLSSASPHSSQNSELKAHIEQRKDTKPTVVWDIVDRWDPCSTPALDRSISMPMSFRQSALNAVPCILEDMSGEQHEGRLAQPPTQQQQQQQQQATKMLDRRLPLPTRRPDPKQLEGFGSAASSAYIENATSIDKDLSYRICDHM